MSTKRFAPKLKGDAVRHGCRTEVFTARLDVPTHSLFKWVKAVTPDKSERQVSKLLERLERNFTSASPDAPP